MVDWRPKGSFMKFLFLLPLLIACQGNGGGGNSDAYVTKLDVSQDVQMNAAIYSDEIILSDLMPRMGKMASECGPTPEPGKRYQYELINDTLILDDQRVQVTYDRETDEGGIINGKWKMLMSSDRNMKSGTLEIDGNKVHFISHCSQ